MYVNDIFSIKELQRLLEARGIPHDDLIEKTDLVEAVENSGGLSTEESEVLMQTASFEESLNFTSERHFLEEVCVLWNQQLGYVVTSHLI